MIRLASVSWIPVEVQQCLMRTNLMSDGPTMIGKISDVGSIHMSKGIGTCVTCKERDLEQGEGEYKHLPTDRACVCKVELSQLRTDRTCCSTP